MFSGTRYHYIKPCLEPIRVVFGFMLVDISQDDGIKLQAFAGLGVYDHNAALTEVREFLLARNKGPDRWFVIV